MSLIDNKFNTYIVLYMGAYLERGLSPVSDNMRYFFKVGCIPIFFMLLCNSVMWNFCMYYKQIYIIMPENTIGVKIW